MKKLLLAALMLAGCESIVHDDLTLAGQWISVTPNDAPANAIIAHDDSVYMELYDDGRGYLTGHIEAQARFSSEGPRIEPVFGYHNGEDVIVRWTWGASNRDHCNGAGTWKHNGRLAWHLTVVCGTGGPGSGYWFVSVANAFHGLWVTDEFDHGSFYYPPDSIFNVPADSVWTMDGSPASTAFECVPTANLNKLRRLHIVTYREALESSRDAIGYGESIRILHDPTNQTMVRESVADERGDKDAYEWRPRLNKRWFAERVIEVKQRHGLAVDPRERQALSQMLSAGTDSITCPDGS